jgi:cell division septal protein FtsQ
VLGFAVLQAFTNARFYVYGSEIRGNQRVASEAIYAASQIDETSIFWIRPEEVARRVMKVPGIATAFVHVRLPDQVIIDVQEQTPTVVWQRGKDTLWLAQNGAAVPLVGEAPQFTLIDPEGAAADAKGGLRPALLAQLMTIHEQRPDTSELFFGKQEGLYFRAPEGYTVYLGSDGDVTLKLAGLNAMRTGILAHPATVKEVDLRVDGRAYVR